MPTVASVFGTYNRLSILQNCIESIRRSAGSVTHEIIVIDAGSTDGSPEWLAQQSDVVLICQQLPLTGAVKAFNLGFARAVDDNVDFVNVFNDDINFVGPQREIETAVELLRTSPAVGAVVWESDHHRAGGRRVWGFETAHGLPYMNQGLVKREAGMAAARFLGDPTGKAWWGNVHLTYAADTEFGLSLWRLGWTVHQGLGLRVHDNETQDGLKAKNKQEYKTADCYRTRFPIGSAAYNRADAVKYGGLLR